MHFCEHSVTTLDFDSTKGNRRTQAATAINEHAALLHLRAAGPRQYGRSWRHLTLTDVPGSRHVRPAFR